MWHKKANDKDLSKSAMYACKDCRNHAGHTYRVIKSRPKQCIVSNLMRNEQHVVAPGDKHAQEWKLHISSCTCHQGMGLHMMYRNQFQVILPCELMRFPHTNLHLQVSLSVNASRTGHAVLRLARQAEMVVDADLELHVKALLVRVEHHYN